MGEQGKIVFVVSQTKDEPRVIFPKKFSAAVAKVYGSRTIYAPSNVRDDSESEDKAHAK